jgi:UDP-N-acetylmuramate dehydrogenase
MSIVLSSVSLAKLTTLKLGGLASTYTKVTSVTEVEAAVAYAKSNHLSHVVIGGGSNILATDSGYDGLVIGMAIEGMAAEPVSSTTIRLTVGAGVELDTLVSHTVDNGWWGIENLSAIPGTVGATPIQNVGAYGVEVADVIESVQVYDVHTMSVRILSHPECQFGYRDSIFKSHRGREYIVLGVTMLLSTIPKPQLHYADLKNYLTTVDSVTQQDIRNAVIEVRSKKFPDWRIVGTAGSFFKNPFITKIQRDELLQKYPDLPMYEEGDLYKVSLGYILDKVCGLRGYTHGNVQLFTAQALVLVALPGATTTEVLAFADFVAATVNEKTKIKIEREVQLLK